jgi:hypothetical protein
MVVMAGPLIWRAPSVEQKTVVISIVYEREQASVHVFTHMNRHHRRLTVKLLISLDQ